MSMNRAPHLHRYPRGITTHPSVRADVMEFTSTNKVGMPLYPELMLCTFVKVGGCWLMVEFKPWDPLT
jgi:hypothetical protein